MPVFLLLPLSVLIFGVIILVAVIWTKQPGWGQESTRLVGLIVVVILAVFLVVVSANQDITKDALTPAFALLGAAAGYLFGKT
jgi:4-amino-4-deoxy-L-arabinose transferase-like glycosyltransferase